MRSQNPVLVFVTAIIFVDIFYAGIRHFGSNLVLMETSIEPTPVGAPFEVALDELQIRRAREGLLRLEGKVFDLHGIPDMGIYASELSRANC